MFMKFVYIFSNAISPSSWNQIAFYIEYEFPCLWRFYRPKLNHEYRDFTLDALYIWIFWACNVGTHWRHEDLRP